MWAEKSPLHAFADCGNQLQNSDLCFHTSLVKHSLHTWYRSISCVWVQKRFQTVALWFVLPHSWMVNMVIHSLCTWHHSSTEVPPKHWKNWHDSRFAWQTWNSGLAQVDLWFMQISGLRGTHALLQMSNTRQHVLVGRLASVAALALISSCSCCIDPSFKIYYFKQIGHLRSL